MSTQTTLKRFTLFVAAATLTIGACRFELDRAAEENQETTGRQDRGRDPGSYWFDHTQPEWTYSLSYTDVILSPDGRTLLASVPVPGPDAGWDRPGLALVAQPLPGGRPHVFADLMDVRRINYSPDGAYAYVLHDDGQTVTRIDMDTFEASPIGKLAVPSTVIDVTPDGRYLLGTNLPTSDWLEWVSTMSPLGCAANEVVLKGASRCKLAVLDTVTGKQQLHLFDTALRDLDFSPMDPHEVITTSWEWDADGQPRATLTFVELGAEAITGTVQVPNCADELKIQPNGSLALLAPVRCRTQQQASADPISVIDLSTRTFLENLPGFGPVDISGDGTRAVGFTRRQEMADEWGYEQTENAGLIVVDLPSLEWEVLEYGEREPTYLLAGRLGRWLYTHETYQVCPQDTGGCYDEVLLTLFDLDLGTKTPVSGAGLALSRFVEAEEGGALYVLDRGILGRIGLGSATCETIPLSVKPELLNIRPQGDYLVLGEYDAPTFHLMPLGHPSDLETLDLSL